MKTTLQTVRGILFITLSICFNAHLFAQSVASTSVKTLSPSRYSPDIIEPLAIGDKVPDVFFENVLYHSSKSAKLSDFKGKFIILDFWSSWCGACISLFPHMDSLQKKFNDKLQVILVNGKSKMSDDDDKKISSIIERVRKKAATNIQLPVVYDCQVLDQYFPYYIIPHEVWINDKGEVVAITSSTEVSYANIKSFVEGKQLNLRVKRDIVDFDATKPLFVDGNAGDANEFLFRSILTAAKEGEVAGTGTRRTEDNRITGFYMFNKPLMTLLSTAFGDFYYQRNKIVTNLDYSLLFPPEDDTKYQYLYCYDLAIPPSSYERMQKYMREDIERYFQITVRQDKRSINCLVLKQGKAIHKSKTKGGQTNADLEKSSLKKFVKNYTLADLIRVLNNCVSLPLLDETNFSYNIDLNLPKDLSDLEAIKKALKEGGFEISEEKRTIEVTVIEKKN